MLMFTKNFCKEAIILEILSHRYFEMEKNVEVVRIK